MPIYPDRKAGKLTGRFRVEVTVAGRRSRGRANSLTEAKALEAHLSRELKTGGKVPASPSVIRIAHQGATLSEAYRKASGILWNGQSTETSSFNKLSRIVSFWGEATMVDSIDTNHIDSLVQSLKDGGSSEATINRYLSCLSAFLRFCKARGHRKAPLPDLEWRRESEGRIRWLTYAEEDTLLEMLPEPYRGIVYADLRTGLRASELLTLVPDQLTPKWVHLWKTKNGSTRSVPITEDVYETLRPIVTEGRIPSYRQLNWAWDKARAAMGFSDDPTFVFHACRHTYATRAIEAGVNIRVLQQLLGHKTIQTTLRYAHVADNTLSDAVDKMHTFHEMRGAIGEGQKAHATLIGA
jgi:integrase